MANPPIKQKLESPELTGKPGPIQSRLNACLASDPGHLVPITKKGEKRDDATEGAVAAIQNALMQIRARTPQLGLPEIKDRQGEYGDDTKAAVLKYKATNAIQRQGQALDAIVGRMTITRIDDELSNKPPPPPPKPVVINAPVEISTTADNPDKGDLNFKPVPNSELTGKQLEKVTILRQKSNSELQRIMRSEVIKGGKFGIQFLDTFIQNILPPSGSSAIDHGVGSDFSKHVAATGLWKVHSEIYRKQLDVQIKALGVNGPFDPKLLVGKVEAPTPSWTSGFANVVSLLAGLGLTLLPLIEQAKTEAGQMTVLIGSFQGCRVFLNDFEMDGDIRTYKGTLLYQLVDHYGVDTSDLNKDAGGHGTEGQVAFWILARERHNPGHMPYRLRVVIREEIRGRF